MVWNLLVLLLELVLKVMLVDKLGQERVLVVMLALLLDIKQNHLLGHLLDQLLLHIQLLVLVVGLLLWRSAVDGIACFDVDRTRYKPPYISHTNPMDLDLNKGTLYIDALTMPAYALATFMVVVAAGLGLLADGLLG